MSLEARVASVRARIARACEEADRDPLGVRLVAVSKTFPPDVILEAANIGLREFGENRAQELRQKASALGDRVSWHFIGHLQSNKVRQVVGVAALIHSVDRFGLAEDISRRALELGVPQDVLIEVNVSAEATKGGIEPARAPALADEVSSFEGIAVKGLMTMPPHSEDPQASRPFFDRLAQLRAEVAETVPGAVELSMGMTQDFEVAIACGATLVRVGEAIFGPRSSAPRGP